MADQALHHWAPRLGRLAGGLVLAVAAAAATVVLAILSFDLNPVGPVLVTFAALAGGGLLAHEAREVTLVRGLGYGLVAGSLLAILLWPFFDVGA